MKLKRAFMKHQNRIIALVFAVLMCTIISVFFDYYYDLNDDVLMKDILAGVYTGTPNGRNIQMLFPISFLLSLFYYLPGNIPWYGIFLCGCQFFSIFAVTNRLLGFYKKTWAKIISTLAESALIITLLLYEMVFVQYTVTATMLAAAAAFLFYTSKTDLAPGKFWKSNLTCVISVVLAYQIRSEMLLLVFPLICVTGLCKWATEKPMFTKNNAMKYFSVFGTILLGMIISMGVNRIAYSDTSWKQFNSFFDSRTQIYDFYEVPKYAENQDFYESIDMDESEQVLLQNYNFGLDEKIDEVLLKEISEYAANERAFEGHFKSTLKKAVLDYKYRLFDKSENPYNLLIICLYLLVLTVALLNRHFKALWQLPLLGVVRTGLWLYILYRGRAPIRITHSLYLIEIAILTAFFFMEVAVENRKNLVLKGALTALAGIFAAIFVSGTLKTVSTEYERRENVNQDLLALQSYAREHSENFYFLDVYSTVRYSEKLFVNVNNSYSNCDIMGGWASKSPLMREKYAKYQIQAMDEALIRQNNVFYVVQSPEPEGWIPVSTQWLPAYYRDKNIEIMLKKADSIRTKEREAFTVYKLQVVK